MRNEIKDKAIFYWQDKLAKFFPTVSGPTSVEIDMFEAGYVLGQKDEEIRLSLFKENEKLREALLDIWHEGICSGKLKTKIEDALWQTD